MARCKNCSEKFTPRKFLWKYCPKEECNDVGVKELLAKTRAASEKKRAAAWKEKKATIKESLKSKSHYEKDLQKEINLIARLIDNGCPCISSNRTEGKWAGGHFHSVGANPALRFNLHNVHIQCFEQNSFKAGNQAGYLEGLEERYGTEYMHLVRVQLKATFLYLGLGVDKLKSSIKIAREEVRHLKKLDQQYPPKARIKLRDAINKKLSIYH